jgi:hypothetical protein
LATKLNLLGCAEAAPLDKSGGAVQLEILSVVEMALRIEMVVNRSVYRDEFLQTSHPPKSQHRPLSSSKWLV